MFELLFKYSPTTFEQGRFVFASGWPIWLLVVASVAATLGIAYSLLQRRDSLTIVKLVALAGIQAAMATLVLVLLWHLLLGRGAENDTIVQTRDGLGFC